MEGEKKSSLALQKVFSGVLVNGLVYSLDQQRASIPDKWCRNRTKGSRKIEYFNIFLFVFFFSSFFYHQSPFKLSFYSTAKHFSGFSFPLHIFYGLKLVSFVCKKKKIIMIIRLELGKCFLLIWLDKACDKSDWFFKEIYKSNRIKRLFIAEILCSRSYFSRVQLFMTPWTVAHQAPLSVEFSRQEYWRGLPFPSPGDLPRPRGRICISLVSCIGRQVLHHYCHTMPHYGKPLLRIFNMKH